MRRRIGAVFPIVFLAWLLQVLAPVNAALSMAAAANVPLQSVSTCGQPPGSVPLQGHEDHQPQSGDCVFCPSAHLASTAPGAPAITGGSTEQAWFLARYGTRSKYMPALRRTRFWALSRGPPALTR